MEDYKHKQVLKAMLLCTKVHDRLEGYITGYCCIGNALLEDLFIYHDVCFKVIFNYIKYKNVIIPHLYLEVNNQIIDASFIANSSEIVSKEEYENFIKYFKPTLKRKYINSNNEVLEAYEYLRNLKCLEYINKCSNTNMKKFYLDISQKLYF